MIRAEAGRADVKRVTTAELEERLRGLEREYRMSSARFYAQARAGLLDERDAFIDWLGYYEAYLQLER